MIGKNSKRKVFGKERGRLAIYLLNYDLLLLLLSIYIYIYTFSYLFN